MSCRARLGIGFLAVAAWALAAGAASASFPGRNGRIVFARYDVGGARLFTMRADGSHKRPLGSRRSYGGAFAPDGRTFVFDDCSADPCRLSLMNADGTHVRRVPGAPDNAYGPSFGPGGRSIAFDVLAGDTLQIHVMRLDGSHRRAIGAGSAPAYSPTVQRIAFSRTARLGPAHYNDTDVYAVDADGSDLRDLTGDGAGDKTPTFSPDGRSIAFAAGGVVGFDQIYEMRADGSHLRRLTNDRAHDGRPVYSPDGRRIAFDSDRTNQDVYVMNRDGTHKRRLTTDPAPEVAVDWQPLP